MKINFICPSACAPSVLNEKQRVESSKYASPNLNTAKNLPVISYPANYYVNFKGAEISDEIKIYEKDIDEFYAENKGKEIKRVSIPSFLPDTMSRLMEGKYSQMLKSVLFYHKAPPMKEERFEQILSKALKKNNAQGTAQDYIRQYKEKNNIEGELLIEDDDWKISKLTRSIADSVKLPQQKWLLTKRVWDDLYNGVTKSNPAVFDENCRNKMKAALKEEPFVSFNEKMLKIHAQERANSSYPAQQCAEDIYKDSIEKKISPFENKRLYDYVTQNNEKLDFLLEKIYGYDVERYTGAFDNSGIAEKHKVLLIDPGVGAHIDELVEYVNKENIDTNNMEPIELRQGFSKYLGTETVYRGFHAESPEDYAKTVKQDGHYASIYRDKKDAVEAIKYYIDVQNTWANTLKGRVRKKIEKPRFNNEFLSLSSVYDIAASITKLSSQPEIPVVVMKVNIPRISLIKQENEFSNMQPHSRHKELRVGYKCYDYDRQQAEIESFSPFYIPPQAIEEVVLDTTTPHFEWY